MGIVNRTLSAGEQRRNLDFSSFISQTSGETGVLCYVPYPCQLVGGNLAAFSVKADVNLLLTIRRFIVGSGVTTINLGTTFVPVDFGTSGVLTAGISLPVSTDASVNLMPNDVIGYLVGGTGGTAAINGLAGTFVVQTLQDRRVYLGNNAL